MGFVVLNEYGAVEIITSELDIAHIAHFVAESMEERGHKATIILFSESAPKE